MVRAEAGDDDVGNRNDHAPSANWAGICNQNKVVLNYHYAFIKHG